MFQVSNTTIGKIVLYDIQTINWFIMLLKTQHDYFLHINI